MRSDDLLFRVGYSLLEKGFVIQPSVLFIQRLGNSSVINFAYPTGPEFIELPQSAPAQLNFLVEGEYKLSYRYSLNTSVALPFLKRKTNVDGLTRAITLSVGMNFSF